MASEKVTCLRLTLGNAPDCWHSVVGIPGFFHPSVPVPVDVKTAKALHADDGCPLSLVTVTKAEADAARELLDEQIQLSRRALREQRRQPAASPLHVNAEQAAVSGAKE